MAPEQWQKLISASFHILSIIIIIIVVVLLVVVVNIGYLPRIDACVWEIMASSAASAVGNGRGGESSFSHLFKFYFKENDGFKTIHNH